MLAHLNRTSGAHTGEMSRAFVKEDGGERWTPPAEAHEYRVVLPRTGTPEIVRETDDLIGALLWMRARPSAGFELRARDGKLLACA